MKLLYTLALVPICCSGASVVSLELDPAKTQVQFTLHDVLHTVHGTFQLKKGRISFDPDSGKASGEIVVDLASGASGSGARDRRMHKEILQSQRYPEAIFTPDRVTGSLPAQGQSQIDVHGSFKIHGSEHELTMRFQVEHTNSQYAASTHFQIPYVEWGMKDPSNFLLKVEKTVDIDIQTTTARVVLESI